MPLSKLVSLLGSY